MKKVSFTLLIFYALFYTANAQSFQLVKDLYPQTENILYDYDAGMTFFNGKVYFTSYYGDIVASDGTSAGTSILSNIGMQKMTAMDFRKNRFVPMGGKLYYINSRNELCVTDGTAPGTQIVTDIHPTDSSKFYGVKSILGANDDKLFLVGHDGVSGYELWVSDGSANGTQIVKDMVPGGLGFFPSSSRHHIGTVINNKLYFFANDVTNGWEPWVSDGTEAGTFMLINSNPSGHCSNQMASTYGGYAGSEMKFFSFNNAVYFVGFGGIYKTDGTTAGTTLELNGANYGANQVITMCTFNNHLYFNQFHAGNKRSLTKSDGTIAGTVVVDTLNKTLIRAFQEFNGELYLLCNDQVNSSSRDYIAKLNGMNVDSITRTTPGYFNYLVNFLQPIGNDFLYMGDYTNHAIYRYNNGANTLANTDFTSTYDNLLSTPIGTFAIGTSATYGYELWKWELDDASDTKKTVADNELFVYPVPTRNTLNITSEDNTDIRILNVSGSVVLKEHLNKGINTIDVSKLVDGLYFMYCKKGTVKRFIIKDN